MVKSFKDFLEESTNYNSWIKPSKEDLTHEYKIEYEIKPLKKMTGDVFPTLQSFLVAANKGKVLTVTPAIDRKIEYRSHTKNKEQLLRLIKTYASYPQYRNEKCIDGLYASFIENKPMTMPIVLEFPDGRMRIMGGNTRMDIATHLGITPKVLLIKIPQKKD